MSATIAFCFKSGMESIRMETSCLEGTKGRYSSNLRMKLGIIPRLVKDIQGKKAQL